MFDLIENHEVLDRSGNLALVHFVNQVMDTAVLVRNMGEENQEVLVLASPLADYPTCLEDAVNNYTWVSQEDKDWSEEGGFD